MIRRVGPPYFLQLPSPGPRPRPWLGGLGQELFGPFRPETMPFDSGLPYGADGQVGDNRGCPVGYFAQRVAPGEVDASQPASIGIVPGGHVAVRCRLMQDYTAAVNAEETGQAAAESWNNLVTAAGEPFRWAGNVALPAIGSGLQQLASWALVGGVLYLFILKEQKGG